MEKIKSSVTFPNLVALVVTGVVAYIGVTVMQSHAATIRLEEQVKSIQQVQIKTDVAIHDLSVKLDGHITKP